MSSMIGFGEGFEHMAACFPLLGRGVSQLQHGFVFGEQLLPTDPQGSMTLALTNVVVGSRYRVEDAATGALVTGGVAAASDVPLTLDYYLPNQTVRIKVRKGSSGDLYKPYETQAVIGSADQTVFIAQIPD